MKQVEVLKRLKFNRWRTNRHKQAVKQLLVKRHKTNDTSYSQQYLNLSTTRVAKRCTSGNSERQEGRVCRVRNFYLRVWSINILVCTSKHTVLIEVNRKCVM